MGQVFLNFLGDVFTSSTTWIVFYLAIVSPMLSWMIVKEFSKVLKCFNIKLDENEKKICRKLLNTLFFSVCVTFLFFHLYVRLFNA